MMWIESDCHSYMYYWEEESKYVQHMYIYFNIWLDKVHIQM